MHRKPKAGGLVGGDLGDDEGRSDGMQEENHCSPDLEIFPGVREGLDAVNT